jgi:hypothetical protein
MKQNIVNLEAGSINENWKVVDFDIVIELHKTFESLS